MSYETGIAAIHLRAAERLAHTEYCTNEALIRGVTGLDPRTQGEAARLFHDAWQFDFLWLTNDGPVPWADRGRTTDMGHSEFVENGRDRRNAKPCPFGSAAEVWEFNAAEEYGLPDLQALVGYYENWHRETQAANPNQVCPGGYYRTLFSGAISSFGWDMLLAAAADRDRFERVLDGFFQLTLHHCHAWAATSIEVFICHDDMVWAEGPFMHPDFYRRSVFPRYRELWRVLKAAGKKVLFCSDGDFTAFLGDLAQAGADGFIFEPIVSLETVVRCFGRTHTIVGSKVDCRTLTFGTEDDIRKQIDATLALTAECSGFIFAVGNHIPSNVPVRNALFYFDHLSRNWGR